MSTYFGHRIINPFRSQVPRGFYDPNKGHTGIDINCPEGTAVSLPIRTTVASVKTQQQMGLSLYLRDSNGKILVFSHLSAVHVNAGDTVQPDQVFAESGNSGTATTGPHLHFEIIAQEADEGLEVMTRTLGEFSGYNVDPVAYLDSLMHIQHWSDDAMNWAREHQIITQRHDPDTPMTWGEFAVASQRLAERIMDWRND